MRVLASTPTGAVCVLALAMTLFGANGAAAEPTAEQVAAIKANCRSDYMSYCWSVPRGGPEAAQCLKKNLAELSPACAQAVKAATAAAAPPSAPAAEAKPATPPAEPAPSPAPAAMAKATAPTPEPAGQTQDTAAKSAPPPSASGQSAPPAGTTAAKEATPAPTPAAASKTAAPTPVTEAAPATAAVKAPNATQVTSPTEPEATTAAVPPSSSEPLGFIPPRKKLMLARNCRHDFKVFCPDVDLGGGRAISCLEDNKAELTPDCRDALAKLAH